jgi:hypothetical protein
MNSGPRHQSSFWPILLIGVGLLFLLANLNLVPLPSLTLLFRLWPVVLVVIGLDLLFGRRAPWLGGLIALLAVAGMFAIVIAAPALNLPAGGQVRTERFTEPVGEAASARVTLDLSEAATTVRALTDSNNLIDANLTYVGEIEFSVQGEQEKTVRLGRPAGVAFDFDSMLGLSPEVRWDIGLTPDIPLELFVDAGSGQVELDFASLRLSALQLDVGSGQVRASLPRASGQFVARIDGGSGQADFQIGEGSNVELVIDGGSGSMSLDAPDGPLRVEVRDSGSGQVRLPDDLAQVSAGDDEDEGAWESRDYGAASIRVTIILDDVGSGSITVH